MDDSLEINNDLKLHEAFEIILSIDQFSDYITDIANLVYENKADKVQIEKILKAYSIDKLTNIKEELLDIILAYIKIILNDNLLTDNELHNIKFLKRLFGIKEGDFFKYRKDEIEEILICQLSVIYRNDDRIDDNEALHKVGLQDLFDLSYDQFLKIANIEDIASLERGANILDLDTVLKSRDNSKFNENRLERMISQEVKDLVWKRDEGKCAICGSNEKIEFDHIIPFSKGGSNTYRNIRLLCESCNRKKSVRI